jgi:hypothetical protein
MLSIRIFPREGRKTLYDLYEKENERCICRPELERLVGTSLRARFRWYLTFAARKKQWQYEEVERALAIIGSLFNRNDNGFFCRCNSDHTMYLTLSVHNGSIMMICFSTGSI